MTQVQQLAAFVCGVSYEDLSEGARKALSIRILDALGCAIGALGAEPAARLSGAVAELSGAPISSLVGGGRTSPDRAALYNGALVRYLDFNDSFLAPGETCHPSDNLAAVLAAAEYAGASGRRFLTALAVAYQVQCRLSEAAPVRGRGFDHTTQGAYGAAAGVAKALGLDAERTANAIAMAGVSHNALRVTRTGRLSNWKGLAAPYAASVATEAAFLAKHGLTGPLEVFEGVKGFMETVSGRFDLAWENESLDVAERTIVKRYNAEVHSQTAIEAILELRKEGLRAEEVEHIDLDVFDVAHLIIGGGREGDKHVVATKEEADHSLPYLVSVALLDGEVTPAQYEPGRIRRPDVQGLLQKVQVRPEEAFSRRFPAEMPCRVTVRRRSGPSLVCEKSDFRGFLTRPAGWEDAVAKFDRLASPWADASLRMRIADAVRSLDSIHVEELATLLRVVGGEELR